ncbi:hypothetical protein [Methylobacterium haplocladii]|nr:hypothetical protein [Methylobacterium haplocladii]
MHRKLDINLYDTHIGIWQDDANDPSFQKEIFGPLIRLLHDHGWVVRADGLTRYRSLRPNYRLGWRGDLRVAIQISGRCIELVFWSGLAEPSNPNGLRYDFDKRKRAPYLDRVRIDLETRRILTWLRQRAALTISPPRHVPCGIGFGEMSADTYIDRSIRSSGHYVPELGRARFYNEPREQTSGDRRQLSHDSTVWFRDRKGRVLRGRAFYSLGQNWLVAAGRWGVYHVQHWDLFVAPPADLRGKSNARARRSRLEGELTRALRRDDYRRAEVLKQILFGNAPIYRIWSRKNDCYYAPNSSGYTSDALGAGRYMRDEAESEVRRVPHILSLVTPDGRHLRAEELDQAKAA